MKYITTLIILGSLLFAGRASAAVPPPPTSDWPALHADAAQSNYNPAEKSINFKNVLKLKVRWAVSISDASYPVVAGGKAYVPFLTGGKVHVRAYNVATGKVITTYPKDASGGILAIGANLYLAGRALQEVNTATGEQLASIPASPRYTGDGFLNPEADGKVIIAPYGGSAPGSIYTVDPQSNGVLHKLPSVSAAAAASSGRIITDITSGSAMYDETSGKAVAHTTYTGSKWFDGTTLSYTVAAVARHNATLYAFNGSGHRVWSQVVGPWLATQRSDWAHAVGQTYVYVHTFKPQEGVEALNAATGKILWNRPVQDTERVALANGILFVLTYALGQSVRLVALKAKTGTPIGAIVLPHGYYAFGADNDLMVASGMVFIRANGPSGPQLLALGPS